MSECFFRLPSSFFLLLTAFFLMQRHGPLLKRLLTPRLPRLEMKLLLLEDQSRLKPTPGLGKNLSLAQRLAFPPLRVLHSPLCFAS